MAPFQLPNILIYLSGVIRPRSLRPHLRVPSIAHVDFQALRKEGYNAVVIDKDNCLTIPNKDDIYPPYQTAWNDLLETFHPGRVLIVSNSAGTRKDPGGIAAESVSLSLRAPILIHSQNKPGCSSNIISYFKGTLGPPTTNRKKLLLESEKIEKEEKKDELMLWERWSNEITTKPLLGYNHEGENERKDRKGDKVSIERYSPKNELIENKLIQKSKNKWSKYMIDDLKILVIGDRLFTDTLLAHRLSLYLPKSKSKTKQILPSVLSIYTTSLPQPKDVKLLRWIEERLSSSKTKGDYSRFILRENQKDLTTSKIQTKKQQSGIINAFRWVTPSRWKEFDQSLPPLTINPKTWKPLPVLVGGTKSFGHLIALMSRYTVKGGKITWIRFRDWLRGQYQRSTEKVTGNESKIQQIDGLLENSKGQHIGSSKI